MEFINGTRYEISIHGDTVTYNFILQKNSFSYLQFNATEVIYLFLMFLMLGEINCET